MYVSPSWAGSVPSLRKDSQALSSKPLAGGECSRRGDLLHRKPLVGGVFLTYPAPSLYNSYMTTTEQIETTPDSPTEKVEVQYWYDLAPYFYFDEAGNKMKVQADTSLLGTKPNFRSDMQVTVLQVLGSEDTIVDAARASLKQLAKEFPPEQNAGLVRRLVKDGHGVPLEHGLISFHLEVPIFVSRQIVKHRHSSINESSGRYSSAIPDFYITHPDKPLVQVEIL